MIAAYVRVSTIGQQKEGYSKEEQIKRANQWASTYQNQEYLLIDDADSGADLTRPGWIKLVDLVTNKKITTLWIADIDRFTREIVGANGLLQLIKDNGIKLYENSIEIDPTGWHSYIKVKLAHDERLKIRDRTLRGRKESANSGNKIKQNIYGYDYSYNSKGKRILIKNENEAKVIQYIYDLFEQGLAFKAIAVKLNNQHIPTKNKGKRIKERNSDKIIELNPKWTSVHVSNILREELYGGFNYNWEHTELLEANKDRIERIIDKEQFLRVKNQIDIVAKKKVRNGYRLTSHECSGIVVCAKCGAKYVYHLAVPKSVKDKFNKQSMMLDQNEDEHLLIRLESKINRTYAYYSHKCDNSSQKECDIRPKNIKAYKLEFAFKKLFNHIFDDPETCKAIMVKLESKNDSEKSELELTIENLKKELKPIEVKEQNLLNAIEQGLVLDGIQDRIKKLNEQKKAILEQIDEANTKLNSIKLDTNKVLKFMTENQLDYSLSSDNPLLLRNKYLTLFMSILMGGNNSIVASIDDGIDFNIDLESMEIN